jgi:hypothetical protein
MNENFLKVIVVNIRRGIDLAGKRIHELNNN